jgi:cation diffusion facilitator family transporter
MLSPVNRTAARLSLAIIIGMIVVKVAVGWFTGSLSVLAQSADSFFDLSAVTISFVIIRITAKPADDEHPFGHGKVESVASITQSLVIFVIGFIIIYFAIKEIVYGAAVKLTEAGMAVMVFSIIVSTLHARYLHRAAKKSNSAALEASARRISTVKYTAAVVLAALIVIRITGLTIFDPIAALLIASWVLKEGVDEIRTASSSLIDTKLPLSEEEVITSTIMEHCSQLVGFHNLRTRKSGFQRYIDLHMVVPKYTSVDEAHRITEHLENDIRKKLPHTSMIIHIEPCESKCGDCQMPCNLKEG